jgi:hypothetical protein
MQVLFSEDRDEIGPGPFRDVAASRGDFGHQLAVVAGIDPRRRFGIQGDQIGEADTQSPPRGGGKPRPCP